MGFKSWLKYSESFGSRHISRESLNTVHTVHPCSLKGCMQTVRLQNYVLWSLFEKHVARSRHPALVSTWDTVCGTVGMDITWSTRMMSKALAIRRILCHVPAATLPGALETHQQAAKLPWHLWVTPLGHHLHHHHVWNYMLMLVRPSKYVDTLG